MKGNKKVLVVALLILLISVSFTTYAIYRTSMSGTGSVDAAKWVVKFKKGNTEVTNLNFSGEDITWTNNPSAVPGKIAPGATGYIEFTIDATGSEVDVYYLATLGDGATEGISVTMPSNSEQRLQYASSNMTATVRINVTWEGALTDSSDKDSTDISKQGTSISIPITVTARQGLENLTGQSS